MDLRSIPRFVWIVCAVHVVFLLTGSLVKPMLGVPDEKHHVDMVVAVGDGEGWPGVQGRSLGPGAAVLDRIFKPRPVLESAAPDRRYTQDPVAPVCNGKLPPVCAYQPSFLEIEEEYPGQFGFVNRMTQHPPLYYVVTHDVAHAALTVLPVPGGVSGSLQILSYRWVSILLIAPLPLIIYLMASILTSVEMARRAATVFPLLLPGLEMRNGPMVNNDNLLLLVASLLTLTLVRLIVDGVDRKRAIIVGVLTGLALFTKGLAIVLPAVVVLAFVLRWRRQRDEGRDLIRQLVLTGFVSLVFGGWWWFRNVVVYGQIQPSGRFGATAAEEGFEPRVLDWLADGYPRFLGSFWGGHLWNADTRKWLSVLAAVVLVVLVAVGVWASEHRDAMLMALTPILLIGATVAAKSWDVYKYEGVTRGAQGRYAYPALAALSVAVGLGLWRIFRRVARGSLAVSILAVIAAWVEARSLRMLFRDFWGPGGSKAFGDSYPAVVAWSPLPEAATHAVFVAFVVGCGALVAAAAWESVTAYRTRSGIRRTPVAHAEGAG